MSNFEIFLYSLVQGITEFLPISSSAHLYFLEDVFLWESFGVTFALSAHLGTLLAVILYKGNFITSTLKNIIYHKKDYDFLLFIIISVMPIIFVGGIISFFFNNYYGPNLLIIGIASITGGIILELADRHNIFRIPEKKMLSSKLAIFVGFFQILSLIPGMSRSGTVITALRIYNVNREKSMSLSLLTGIPVQIVACSYILFFTSELGTEITKILFFIFIISFFSALVSISFIFSWIKRFSFSLFVIYRIFLGLVILTYIFFYK